MKQSEKSEKSESKKRKESQFKQGEKLYESAKENNYIFYLLAIRHKTSNVVTHHWKKKRKKQAWHT